LPHWARSAPGWRSSRSARCSHGSARRVPRSRSTSCRSSR
jgi:hypothetical protein